MKKIALTLVCFFALVNAACGDDDEDSRLTVENQSSVAFEAVFVTPVASTQLGPNILGGDVLLPGEAVAVDVECGFYDVQIVQDTGAVCDLFDVELCFENAVFVIDDAQLSACTPR